MSLRLHDTQTRTVRPFEPLRAGAAGVYVCGPTPQASPHVGHLRSAVAMDVLHRWLLESGYDVTFIRNVTDVDDKIIAQAHENDEPWWALTTRVGREFDAAYDAVGVLPATGTPRVTGSIIAIVALIERIIERGHAYAADGDVYLAVRDAPDYGHLSGQSPDQLRAGTSDFAGSKRDPLDFALWKSAKPGEPSWPSPWGPGRPGWHIECSAMAVEHLGEQFDLHAGGLDLVFPHHENEIAQSACAGHPFARYWLHHGLVTLTGGAEKMSKSIGNVVTAREILDSFRPAVLRYALGAAHYRSSLEWGPGTIAEAEAAYGRIETFVRNARAALGPDADAPSDPELSKVSWGEFAAALDEDLGVPQALAVVHSGVRTGNALLADGELPALAATLAVVRRMLSVLALDPVTQWPGSGGELLPVVDTLVELVVQARAAARERKDWAQADAMRDRLAEAGVLLEDTAGGLRWRLAR